jgi:hypothetical protein
MPLTFFGPQPCRDYCDNAEALRRNPSLTHLNQSPGLADSLLLIREALTSTIAQITLLLSSGALSKWRLHQPVQQPQKAKLIYAQSLPSQ